MWRFWIDVGGTFTDCIGLAPDGSEHQCKCLSSGLSKGLVTEFLTGHDAGTPGSLSFTTDSFPDLPNGFWNGATLHWIGVDGGATETSEVVNFTQSDGGQRFEIKPQTGNSMRHADNDGGANRTVGARFELSSGFHAPILAIRQLLRCPISQPLPACEIRLGTTRGTNALLTRSGARTALVTSSAMEDLLAIGDQARPDLFALAIEKVKPLYSAAIAIGERVLADGTIKIAPDETQIKKQLEDLKRQGIQSIAVCLMHSFQFPEHERQVGKIAGELGFNEIRLSHQIAPLIKIVPRAETTVLDAYLNPVIGQYIAAIAAELDPESSLQLMTSSGGLAAIESFSGKDSVLSGPAGGVVGAAGVGRQTGFEQIIAFDMGGTSTDVSRFGGDFEIEYESTKAGVRVVTPMLAIETVAAGGGSICWFDGTRLQVGPQSAGSDPGPACYGRGGPLTVTDLNLFLGRLHTDLFPFALDGNAVQNRLMDLCDQLNDAGFDYTPVRLARGFLDIANHNMAAAIESISVRKGYDPKTFTLLAFGGAGAQHCCAVAEKLGIVTIIDHPHSSILSALGIGMAQRSSHAVQSILKATDEFSQERLDEIFAALYDRAAPELHRDLKNADRFDAPIQRQHTLELRYQGVDNAFAIQESNLQLAVQQFTRQHQQFFGYTQNQPIEIVTVRMRCSVPGIEHPAVDWSAAETINCIRSPADSGSGGNEISIFRRDDLNEGDRILGPAMVAAPLTTSLIDEGWSALVGPGRILRIERQSDLAIRSLPATNAAQQHLELPQQPDPVQLEIFNQHFSAIATQMGACLQRTSISVNVKERLDFSCAVFTGVGDLVVNAPHIPVHLGAMSETVKATIALNDTVNPGDVFVTNDPYAGGSHLPDITVLTPVFAQTTEATRGTGIGTARPTYWVASRSHHAEIGGKTPGSMPPDATCLAEEGVLIENFRLIDQGQPNFERLQQILSSGDYPSRSVAENISDIKAQIAANQSGANGLISLTAQYGLPVVTAYMRFIQDAAEELASQAIRKFPDGRYHFSDRLDNGATIQTQIEIAGESLSVDFAGTDPVLAGNLNANPAIVRSAVMYLVRMLIETNIPLNEGIMRPVSILNPVGCFLNPAAGATPADSPAIVGGNVETSQRIVDVLLGALGIAAASQGTMNNWLIGDETFGYYETVGGGSGATSTASGASAVHVHMTNTRLTDPEILETRYPVVLNEFYIRHGSGGQGRHRGGDGMVREVEFQQPLTVSLLTNRRNCAPYGMKGGLDGAPGSNHLFRADGTAKKLAGIEQIEVDRGDRLRIETPGGGGFGQP